MPGPRLTENERIKIEVLFGQGLTAPAIAVEIERDRSTVWRELKRNNSYRGNYMAEDDKTRHPDGKRTNNPDGRGGIYRWIYHAPAAHARATERARRPRRCKLVIGQGHRDGSPPLWDVVVDKLKERWSPQQIATWLREEYPDQPEMWVSHETIYQAIFIQGRGGFREELSHQQALRTGRAARRKQSREATAARSRRPWVVDFHISTRPAEVEDRAVPGHWEGDLVIGARGTSAIITLVERSTRFVMLGALPNSRVSEEVITVLAELMGRVPAELARTLTWDQGAELQAHARFTLATGCKVYFCDPHSPWQRGSNENTNGLLRQYFPRSSTDFRTYTQADLDTVARELNGRPRQTLGWKNPARTLNTFLVATAA